MDSKPLSTRTCFLLVLLFGVATYANTLTGSFQFDDIPAIIENRSLYPVNLVRLWHDSPLRFIAYLSFVFNIYFAGFQTWSFHVLNILIHILASWMTFKLTKLILKTPAMKNQVLPSQHDLFALVAGLLFLVHPIQTQAVSYLVQRLTSLATLFYLATLLMYLKARLENSRYYGSVCLFMLAAMLTKEISITLPFSILLMEFCFFPVSETETLRKKLLRWSPFALFLLVIPFFLIVTPRLLIRAHGTMNVLPTLIQGLPRWKYLLTEFRVIRTYLGLLFWPVGQRLIYDYPLSTSFADPDAWAAFSLLFSVFLLGVIFIKKNRLMAFGIFWFFLTLSVESSIIPLPDVIFEHRLYLPMFGFALFTTSFLWRVARSLKAFFTVSLTIILALSGMTYARNEVWKSAITLFQDAVKKTPRMGIAYAGLADAYNNERADYRKVVFLYEKAISHGFITPAVLHYLSMICADLGDKKKSAYYQKLIAKVQGQELNLVFSDNRALDLMQKGKTSEAIDLLRESIRRNPDNPMLYIQLGEIHLKAHREKEAVLSFQDAIRADPLYIGGYNALALFYKERNHEAAALDVFVRYFRTKKIHQPLFGSIDLDRARG